MASPPTTSKVTSRWGSFLAGVESKLDTILADESTTSTPTPAKDEGTQEQPLKNEAKAVPVTKSRPDSMVSALNRVRNGRPADRDQARLDRPRPAKHKNASMKGWQKRSQTGIWLGRVMARLLLPACPLEQLVPQTWRIAHERAWIP